MGYNTGIFFLNDAIMGLDDKNELEKWWERTSFAINTLGLSKSINVPIGNHAHGSTVFHIMHSNEYGMWSLGGNVPVRLFPDVYDVAPSNDIELLKTLAKRFGYKLVRLELWEKI